MKLLILLLLPFFSFAQATTYEPRDSTWITSSDTTKVKVYKDLNQKWDSCYKLSSIYVAEGRSTYKLAAHSEKWEGHADSKPSPNFTIRCECIPPDVTKYDTIGPVWKQVSDLTPGYNPVMAMQLYEVRVYKSEWISVNPNKVSANGSTTLLAPHPEQATIPFHFKWLDIKKHPFRLAVWEDKTLSTTATYSLDDAISMGMFDGCPIPNPTFKEKWANGTTCSPTYVTKKKKKK